MDNETKTTLKRHSTNTESAVKNMISNDSFKRQTVIEETPQFKIITTIHKKTN